SSSKDINPDEIFVDSENLPEYDKHQLEGRIEKPISTKSLVGVVVAFSLLGLGYLFQVWDLQIGNGKEFYEISENNSLRHTLVFADRGIVYDRNGTALAWNEPTENPDDFSKRKYLEEKGFSNVLGYVKYPQKDSSGYYYTEEFSGFAGVEDIYNDVISGENGLKIIETNALQEVVGDNTIKNPETGSRLDLTIDADLQNRFYLAIEDIATQVGFTGGAGIIMDVTNGEINALVSYPEFDSNALTLGEDSDLISEQLNDPANRFLNRATKGLYTPGSIMKPYVAIGALNEGVVTPFTKILSTGKLVVPNRYNPDNPTIFSDWKAHGSVDVREALAYSSNVYFYEVGGGFEQDNQEGIGINKLEEYYRSFGFGKPIKDDFLNGPSGTIPNPKWKEENFDGDPWRIGDTYFTSIGQYGLQVTPIQVARAVSALANNGKVIEPKIVKNSPLILSNSITDVDKEHFETVKAGMRDTVVFGLAKGLDIPEIEVAAKTGTAELGVSKARVNSWVTGFFPYESPKYAFVVVMEQGSRTNLVGGVAVMRQLLDWIRFEKPQYLGQ
ncbi:penicillin-binding transpeptidase domain-containing protein, partial [Candidatus Pacebacteria bacterium]|nr:penicillin-binding transpeptidase domain-containing protein [Candidatus Paceibacterota bacterium]